MNIKLKREIKHELKKQTVLTDMLLSNESPTLKEVIEVQTGNKDLIQKIKYSGLSRRQKHVLIDKAFRNSDRLQTKYYEFIRENTITACNSLLIHRTYNPILAETAGIEYIRDYRENSRLYSYL